MHPSKSSKRLIVLLLVRSHLVLHLVWVTQQVSCSLAWVWVRLLILVQNNRWDLTSKRTVYILEEVKGCIFGLSQLISDGISSDRLISTNLSLDGEWQSQQLL